MTKKQPIIHRMFIKITRAIGVMFALPRKYACVMMMSLRRLKSRPYLDLNFFFLICEDNSML